VSSNPYLPPYRRIANALRLRISDGTYMAGDRLPSEADLVREFGVSRMTARHAIEILRQEGLVESQHGRGVFVLGNKLHAVLDRVVESLDRGANPDPKDVWVLVRHFRP
jgi:DNA-binding GntR family transcriptional regulator